MQEATRREGRTQRTEVGLTSTRCRDDRRGKRGEGRAEGTEGAEGAEGEGGAEGGDELEAERVEIGSMAEDEDSAKRRDQSFAVACKEY